MGSPSGMEGREQDCKLASSQEGGQVRGCLGIPLRGWVEESLGVQGCLGIPLRGWVEESLGVQWSSREV